MRVACSTSRTFSAVPTPEQPSPKDCTTPRLSYTICFSQRTGSTLPCPGMAGSSGSPHPRGSLATHFSEIPPHLHHPQEQGPAGSLLVESDPDGRLASKMGPFGTAHAPGAGLFLRRHRPAVLRNNHNCEPPPARRRSGVPSGAQQSCSLSLVLDEAWASLRASGTASPFRPASP